MRPAKEPWPEQRGIAYEASCAGHLPLVALTATDRRREVLSIPDRGVGAAIKPAQWQAT